MGKGRKNLDIDSRGGEEQLRLDVRVPAETNVLFAAIAFRRDSGRRNKRSCLDAANWPPVAPILAHKPDYTPAPGAK